ncbi:hypothetical protein CXK97_02615 [Stutzerimonas stutzeri]|nr:DUF1652 domain-containing protein [Stutzerimonas stutzeri]PNG15101.1 hypothetical protein CXK97_02615 [Stutzerimonas stutzeri]
MTRIRLPEALALVQEHFKPLRFCATMDSPQTIQAMLLDELTGESLVLPGLPCGVSVTRRAANSSPTCARQATDAVREGSPTSSA